ncbi:MerR family transcriptional regulator [Nocardiopsis sp. NPDC055879]
MTVGAAAKAAGVSAKAVRLWESKGLLPSAERTGAGYRLFTDADVEVLCFIRQAKTLGLSLAEIKDVLDLRRRGDVPCARVTGLLDAHIADIDRTLADLRQLRSTLTSARRTAHENHCQGTDAAICQIIETAPRAG